MIKSIMSKRILRIATRKSPLALWQANHIADQIKKICPELVIELLPIVTSGDRFLKDKLQEIGGKGLFVKELEEALLSNQADLAVHSMKDVPAEFPEGLVLATICKRHHSGDAFVSNHFACLNDLPPNSIVGTSSLRRQSQLLALRPDLQVESLRGNIHTRLDKLDKKQYDAIILAVAGLQRMGLHDRVREIMSPQQLLPACGQGALGLECRMQDQWLQTLLKPLNDSDSALCVRVERDVNARLGGNCHVPLAVLCEIGTNQQLHLQARVLSLDGSIIIEDWQKGSREDSQKMAEQCADNLLKNGAAHLLAQSL